MMADHRPDQAILAVVGEGMKGRPGIAGKLFDSLGRNNININAIAQGASERNISCVIDAAQQVRALNAIHQAFFESRKRLALAVVGVGNIGSALLEQLRQQRHYLLSRGFDVRVVALANSRRFVVSPSGVDLANWKTALGASRSRMSPEGLAEPPGGARADQRGAGRLHGQPVGGRRVSRVHRRQLPHHHAEQARQRAAVAPVFGVDGADGAAPEALLLRSQRRGRAADHVHAARPDCQRRRDPEDRRHPVGHAQLSVQQLRRPRAVQRAGARRAPAGVHRARSARRSVGPGRGEKAAHPRPRDRAADGAGRGEGGQPRAAPAAARHVLANGSSTTSRNTTPTSPAAWRPPGAAAPCCGTSACWKTGAPRRGSKEFPRDHPVASAKGSDNVIAFTTKRYRRTPLVVQGPGAGADVTAMGVFSDILKLLHYLPR